MKVIVVGDLHGRASDLNILINKKKPDIVIQTGDFGMVYAGSNLTEELDKIKPHNTKIYFCLGNHEYFPWYEDNYGRIGDSPIEIRDNIFYCPIGSILNIFNKNILFIGGAESIDRDYRVLNVDYFPQEIVTNNDTEYVLNRNIKVHGVVSHTCPYEFNIMDYISNPWKAMKDNDPTKKGLSSILNHFKPQFWYFGHYHGNVKEQYNNTRWYCLNKARETGWWRVLEP